MTKKIAGALQPSEENCIAVSGDKRIAAILSRPGAIVEPAYACSYDGFINDTLTEYANPSIVRPPSVCAARLSSRVCWTLRWPGNYYAGFTMYDASGARYFGFNLHDPAGDEEILEVWLGNRRLATVRSGWRDNRLRLFVITPRLCLKSWEELRLVTAPNRAAYRIENMVLLPRLPQASRRVLEMSRVHAAVAPTDGGKCRAIITWITNVPATGRIEVGGIRARGECQASSHRIEAPGLRLNRDYVCRVRSEAPGLSPAEVRLKISTRIRAPETVRGRKSVVLRIGPAAATAEGWPVTTGLPFARGGLGDPRCVRLLAAGGAEVPCQTEVTARWSDGGVKWLLLTFQADVTKGGISEYTFEYGREIARAELASPLRVEMTPRGVAIATGCLKVEIRRDAGALPGAIAVFDPQTGRFEPACSGKIPGLTLVDRAGWLYQGSIRRIAIEENGPERAVVRLDLVHRDRAGKALFNSMLRLHAFRGQPWLRVFHTFTNDADALFTIIRSLKLATGLAETVRAARLGKIGVTQLTAAGARLFQRTDRRFDLRVGGETRGGRRAAGWIEVAAGDLRTLIAVRDFWQNYPKAFAVKPELVEVELCPDLGGADYHVGGLEEDRLFYYLLDGGYKLHRGMSKTHELLYHFSAAGIWGGRVVAQLFQAPPPVRAPVAFYIASGVVGDIAPRDPRRFGYGERWIGKALRIYQADAIARRAYGMLNYGDWHGERRYNWGNMEYDTPWGWMLEFLRGGDPACFELSLHAARHQTDVDTCHYDPRRNVRLSDVGGQYAHCVGHAGDYYQQGYRELASAVTGMTPCHIWVEGLFLAYALTGDRRLRKCAEKTCRYLFSDTLNHYDFTNCRGAGWLLIHALAAYNATGDEACLNAAQIIVKRVLERQRPSGGWERMLVPGHCFCPPPRHAGEAGFMVGVLLAGLRRYHRVTGDPAVARTIVRGAENLVRDMWMPREGCCRYTSCPASQLAPGLNAQILEGIGYAQRLSGSKVLRAVVRRGLRGCFEPLDPRRMGDGCVSKEISTNLRSVPFILFELARMGLKKS